MLRKLICALIPLAVLAIIPVMVLASNAETSSGITGNFDLVDSKPQFFGDLWFEKTVNQIEIDILAEGYAASAVNSLGKAIGAVSYENEKYQPKKITVIFDTETQTPTSISYTYAADKEAYAWLYDGMNETIGEAHYQEAYTEKQNTYSVEYSEALLWQGTNYQFKLNAEGGDKTAGIYQVQTGRNSFVFTTSYDGNLNAATDKAKGLISAASNRTTPKPTTKPRSVRLDVEIASVRIGKDSIGNPEVFVVFKNTSKNETIDRIDFSVRCYDAYGAEIKPYGFYDWTDNFYDDKELRPGRTTSSDWRWTIYGVEGTKSVKIAISKYHTTSGKTVEVPTESLVWKSYK